MHWIGTLSKSFPDVSKILIVSSLRPENETRYDRKLSLKVELCPMCCLQKVDKLYHETEEDFLLYMAAATFNYFKEGSKGQKLQF